MAAIGADVQTGQASEIKSLPAHKSDYALSIYAFLRLCLKLL
jgi:hypothetical protein